MIVISIALVLVGFVTLMLGVLGVGERPLEFVYASIGACLLAAVLLAAGVLRGRPSSRPPAAEGGDRPTWSGAVPPRPAPSGPAGRPEDSHVQVLSAREAAEGSVAAASTVPLDLSGAARDEGGGNGGASGDVGDDGFARALAGLELDTARVERLRGRFVTAERLAAASPGEIAEVPGIPAALAETISAHLRSRA